MKVIKPHEKKKERKENTYVCMHRSRGQTRLCFRGLERRRKRKKIYRSRHKTI